MELIKKKISLDKYTSREQSNWGQMTATTFNINVFFTQDMDDMGIATDIPFIEQSSVPVDYTELTKIGSTINLNGLMFAFMTGATSTTLSPTNTYPSIRYPGYAVNHYYTINGINVTGLTEDRLDVVSSYNNAAKYQPGFDITKSSGATDYQSIPFTAGTRVITNSGFNPITYLIEGDTSAAELALLPITKRGIYFDTASASTRTVSTIGGIYQIPYTEMSYNSEGYNATNILLSASTREEYLFGITSSPTVFSDLFIERGRITVLQSHMQLGEITNMRELINYGNGFYKIQN